LDYLKRAIQIRLDPAAIGRRIREIRGFDLTQAEMGKVLGVTQAGLSKLERGERLPTLEVLLKLRVFCGKSIDWMITGEESVPSPPGGP
jgi:transcriptional regulator with XRE-family HTH domain